MKVKDLIKVLLDADMDDEIEILLSKGKSVSIFKVHHSDPAGHSSSGVHVTSIEAIDDLKSTEE